jgi:hypothetical protein
MGKQAENSSIPVVSRTAAALEAQTTHTACSAQHRHPDGTWRISWHTLRMNKGRRESTTGQENTRKHSKNSSIPVLSRQYSTSQRACTAGSMQDIADRLTGGMYYAVAVIVRCFSFAVWLLFDFVR